MARGTESKEKITKQLLDLFKDSFINGKEIRVPMIENGEEIQVKITLTAAKDNLPHVNSQGAAATKKIVYTEPTEKEKEMLAQALKDFGIK